MIAGASWDRCGAPLLQLGDGTLVHALPVTVYHIERHVWAGNSAGLDWERVLPKERLRPPFAAEESPEDLWVRRLTVEQAEEIAHWLGGRLPTRSEWRRAVQVWDDGRSLASSLRPCPEGDERLRGLVSALACRHVSQRSVLLPQSFAEFAAEFRRGSRGAVSIMSMRGPDGVVAQGGHATFCDDSVGFCCAFDEASGDAIQP